MHLDTPLILAVGICLVTFFSGLYLNRPTVSINRMIKDLSVIEKFLLIGIAFLFPVSIIAFLPLINISDESMPLEKLFTMFFLSIFCYYLGVFGIWLGDRIKSE